MNGNNSLGVEINLPVANLPVAKIFQVCTTFLLGCIFLANSSSAVGQKLQTTGKQWPAAERVAIGKIQHDSFDKLLKKYVDKNGMVNYKAWHASTADRNKLTNYIESLSRADLEQQAERGDKLAFWINAYNAVTLEGILRVYPTTSIRNHTAKALGYNVWKHLMLIVDDKQINLDSIEHKVLRKMSEPRIHFAIVCASIGCPRLMNEAYVGKNIEKQLVTNTKDFFSRSQNLQFDSSRNALRMNQILSWFGSDFGNSSNEQLRAIHPYFPKEIQTAIGQNQVSVEYLEYDWNLNAQK